MRFSVGTNRAGEPSWWLYGDNNEQVAWAGETFYSQSNATRAAQDFKDGAASATYDVYLDDGGREHPWRANRGGRKVAASGEGVPTGTKKACRFRQAFFVVSPRRGRPLASGCDR